MTEVVETVCGVTIGRPPDAAELLDEQQFEARDEFMPYWAELWPSARRLAEVVCRRPWHGMRVLELGCGLGLPAICAARGGATVLATDWAPEAVAATRANAARNGVTLDAEVVDWREPGALLGSPWDVVLAADVLYEERNARPLSQLVRALDGELWLADPGRPQRIAFLAELRDWPADELAPGVLRLMPPRR